jgi:membrane protease YdiL (CAAX protease family)
MTEEPPPPDFQLPSHEPRRTIVWPILALAVLLLALGAALPMTKGPPRPPDYSRYEIVLEQAVRMKVFEGIVARSDVGQRSNVARQADALLDRPVSELVDKTDGEAAAIYAVMRFEQGRPILPEKLTLLAKDDSARLRAIGAIYAADRLTPDRARELSDQLGDGIVDRVATGHARLKAGLSPQWPSLMPLGRWLAQSVLTGVVAIGFFGGLAVWVVYLRARAQGKFAPLGWPVGTLEPGSADRLGMRFVLFLLLFPLLSTLFAAGLGTTFGVPGVVLAGAVAMLLSASICLRVRVFGKRSRPTDYAGARQPLGRLVLIGLAGALAEIPVVLATLGISLVLAERFPSPGHPAQELMRSPTALSIIAFVIAGVIVAPLVEEFVFRGVLAPALSALRGPRFGVVVSSFVFACMHPQGVAGWPPLMAVGAMCALVTYQSRSIVPAIVLHAVHNGFVFLLGLVMQ